MINRCPVCLYTESSIQKLISEIHSQEEGWRADRIKSESEVVASRQYAKDLEEEMRKMQQEHNIQVGIHDRFKRR